MSYDDIQPVGSFTWHIHTYIPLKCKYKHLLHTDITLHITFIHIILIDTVVTHIRTVYNYVYTYIPLQS